MLPQQHNWSHAPRPPTPERTPHPTPPPALRQCGIVYCLARAECERVAEELETRLSEQIFAMPRGRRRVK